MIDKIRLLIAAMHDKRTPWYAKAIVVLAIAYILSPIDLIPDFIPVIGLLDEVILIPLIYKLVMRLVPGEVKVDAEPFVIENNVTIYKLTGLCIVLSIWLFFIYLVYHAIN